MHVNRASLGVPARAACARRETLVFTGLPLGGAASFMQRKKAGPAGCRCVLVHEHAWVMLVEALIAAAELCPAAGLLQMGTQEDAGASGDSGSQNRHHVALALSALAEALACPPGPSAKPYVAALLKLAAGLPLDGASQVLCRHALFACRPSTMMGHTFAHTSCAHAMVDKGVMRGSKSAMSMSGTRSWPRWSAKAKLLRKTAGQPECLSHGCDARRRTLRCCGRWRRGQQRP